MGRVLYVARLALGDFGFTPDGRSTSLVRLLDEEERHLQFEYGAIWMACMSTGAGDLGIVTK